MAFGRSNSLSINTGATNNLFAQQNQTSQPAQTAGLFGSSTSKPGGLFGSTTTTQPQQTTSLFGGSNNASNTTGQTGGGLFGANNQTQSQPQQGGGLFGGSLAQNQQNQTQSQPAQGGSLFGGLGQQQQQKPAGGLFGGLGQQQSNQPAQTNNTFGGGLSQSRSIFGGSTAQQPQQQPSLLAASLFNNSTTAAPIAGSLTMGQGSASNQVQPGVKIDLSNLRPTTRFSDLHDELKSQIEQIDTFIKQQESYASQCEAMIPSHSTTVSTLPPDIALIESKAETVELGLENDSRAISDAKDLVKSDIKDLFRCVRVIENQALPSRFHYGPTLSSTTGAARSQSAAGGLDEEYDVDLPGYFSRQIEDMTRTRSKFEANLAEIESHLGVVERRTAVMVGEVSRERHTAVGDGENTVRELADTLRGFEGGILDAARRVGGCREGLEELITRGRY